MYLYNWILYSNEKLLLHKYNINESHNVEQTIQVQNKAKQIYGDKVRIVVIFGEGVLTVGGCMGETLGVGNRP